MRLKESQNLTVSAPVWDKVNIRNYIERPEIDAIKVKVQTQRKHHRTITKRINPSKVIIWLSSY